MRHFAGSMPRLTILLLAALSSGCSFALVRGPPPPDVRDIYLEAGVAPNCTNSMAVPSIDGILAGLSLPFGLYELSAGDAVALVDIVIGGMAVWSAIQGRQKVKRCQEFLSSLVIPPVPDTIPKPGRSPP